NVQRRLEKARKSSLPIKILTERDFTPNSSSTLTWKYSTENFPDFAFAFSDHFLWEAATISDDEGDYFVHTAYSHNNSRFQDIFPSLAGSLKILHNTFPKYPFPYNNFTIFNGQDNGG